jgi:hypothetical protein
MFHLKTHSKHFFLHGECVIFEVAVGYLKLAEFCNTEADRWGIAEATP